MLVATLLALALAIPPAEAAQRRARAAATTDRAATQAETANRAMNRVILKIGSAAGFAHVCGQDRVARLLAEQANALVIQHAVEPREPTGPRSWQAIFDFAARGGRTNALYLGCRGEDWTRDWRDANQDLRRANIPARPEAEVESLNRDNRRFVAWTGIDP
jgi:hypothetical protein